VECVYDSLAVPTGEIGDPVTRLRRRRRKSNAWCRPRFVNAIGQTVDDVCDSLNCYDKEIQLRGFPRTDSSLTAHGVNDEGAVGYQSASENHGEDSSPGHVRGIIRRVRIFAVADRRRTVIVIPTSCYRWAAFHHTSWMLDPYRLTWFITSLETNSHEEVDLCTFYKLFNVCSQTLQVSLARSCRRRSRNLQWKW